MSLALRVLLIFMALVSTYSMLKKIKKFKMQIEYAIFWVIFSVALIIMAIYPKIFDIASKILGVYSPANLVFAFIIFILLVKVFLMTVELSSLETRVKELTQEIDLERLKKTEENLTNTNNNKGRKRCDN